MNINEMTLEQLKAAAYDCLARIEMEQNNLRLLNQAITAKNQPVETPNP